MQQQLVIVQLAWLVVDGGGLATIGGTQENDKSSQFVSVDYSAVITGGTVTSTTGAVGNIYSVNP